MARDSDALVGDGGVGNGGDGVVLVGDDGGTAGCRASFGGLLMVLLLWSMAPRRPRGMVNSMDAS